MTKNKPFDWILLVILMSYFMILLDNSIIFTGTVKIAQDLNLNQATLSWVSSAYSLTFGGFLLLGGRAGDLFGRRRIFQIGLVIFGLGSLLVGLAVNAPMIIASRAFQGIGSAILAPRWQFSWIPTRVLSGPRPSLTMGPWLVSEPVSA